LSLLVLPAVASAQLNTGDLYGSVDDQQHQALPGVTLTLTGVGAPKVAVSDEKGNFRFVGLYPGQYALRAELDGFSTVEQTGIEVKLGSKLSLELSMSSAVRETITVTAEHMLLNPREQNSGPVLTPQELEKLPTARDPWSLLRQAPGVQVDRVNVGGNESGQQSAFFVGGATSADNTFAVDGAIETDMAAVGSSASYYDFGAYEEFQLTTASTDVAIQTAGVTINQITKRGSNVWKGDARYLKTDGSLQSKPSTDGYPAGIVGNEIDSIEEYGANVGGPLVQDHLWIWGSYGISDIRNLLGVTGQVDRTKLTDTNAKLNFQLQGNSGSVLFWTNDKQKFGRGAAFDRPPETTWDQTTPADRWKVEDTQVFGSTFTLSALWAKNDGAFTLHPKGGNNATAVLDEEAIWRNSFFVFDQTATIDQGKLEGNWFASGSGDWNHELKFGASYRKQQNDSLSSLPGPGYAVLTCEGFGCDPGEDNIELVEWIRHNVAVTTKYQAAWIQDTVTHDRLTITAGLRYDDQKAHNDAVVDPGQPDVPDGLLPRIDFKGDDAGGLDWKSIVPRLGVTYAMGQDRHTLLRGTYSRYAAQLGQWVSNLVGPTAAYSYLYFYFTDANRNLRLDPSERASLSQYAVYNVNLADPSKAANRMDPNVDPYMTDEATLGLQHAFGNNVAVSATLQYRQTTDLLETRALIFDAAGNERLATRADYQLDADPVVRILPDGRTVSVPTYSLRDGLSSSGGSLVTNGDRKLQYWGLTLGVEKPMANRWSLRSYATYGDTKLKVGSQFKNFDDPTDIISLGFGLWGDNNDIYVDESYGTHRLVLLNSRWSFNVSGIYQVAPDRPWGFNVAGSFSGREGYPFVPAASRSVHAVQVAPRLDEFRFQDLYTVDARIDKDFTIGDFKLTTSIDGFNLLNTQPVLERNPKAPSVDDGPAGSYQVVARLSPRVFRWGITVHFR
jgi:hypothetical protein